MSSIRIMMSYTVAMEILLPSYSEMTVGVEKMLYKSQMILFLVANGQNYF